MKERYINELLWHISLFGYIYFFNRNRLPWCQLELLTLYVKKWCVHRHRNQYLSFDQFQICHRSTNIKLYGKY